jgi:NitT/TauT family transport system substrate-binding protein
MRRRTKRALVLVGALTILAAACGSDNSGSSSATTAAAAATTATTAASGGATTAAAGPLKKVKLQLQWVTQAQFAGYFAAKDQGFFKKFGLDVELLEGAVDIIPQTVLAQGNADFAIAWVPKALASREQGANITDIAQIFQRSGTLQISFKDKNITAATALKGKTVGNWGFGNEFELFAGMTKAGLNPGSDVKLVQQEFNMTAFLNGDIDAAQAMTYNEYAQVLEAKNPATGKLFQPSELNVIKWQDDGTGMLQDAIWADTAKLKNDTAYQDTAVKLVAASIEGWAYCRDNPEKCRDIVVAAGSKLGNSHQLWQMNEINKLIWPATNGAGMIDKAAWDQTASISQQTKNQDGATVITKPPAADAYSNDYVTKALALVKADGVDAMGAGFKPLTVTLEEGGA